AHVDTPGCSLVYAAGARRFLMLCANGAALSVMLDDEGGEARLERSEPFFDPQKDPVTEKAVRRGNEWLFVSFEGVVHPVDVSGRFTRWLLTRVLPNTGVERILVTQDEHPVLVASASLPPSVTIHDAMTGAVLREVSEPGLAGSLLFAP